MDTGIRVLGCVRTSAFKLYPSSKGEHLAQKGQEKTATCFSPNEHHEHTAIITQSQQRKAS